MRHACLESSIHSVRSDPSNDTLVCAESAALSGVGCDLHAVLPDYAMDALLVDLDALLPKLSVDPAEEAARKEAEEAAKAAEAEGGYTSEKLENKDVYQLILMRG